MNASPFWVLASNNPADLAHFYAALANENAIKKGAIWLVAFAGAGELLFYCPSRQRPQPAQVGRLALCLPVTKLEQAIALALTLGGNCWSQAARKALAVKPGLLIRRATNYCCWSRPK
ncbi:hypothetical protein AAF134_06055 [Synechococcus lacustris Tous-12m]